MTLESRQSNRSFTDNVDCPWLDDVGVLCRWEDTVPGRLAKIFIGDEAFGNIGNNS